VLRDIRVVKGSGNTEMDTAVQDALRLWKFPPIAPTTRTVKGRITYWIIPR
jgi:TonB family protein